MIHQIGHKLREQIHRFSGELSTGLGKVKSRFVEEMIYGISASGSVVLSKVARSLEEPIRLHDTHKRLSANLDSEKLKGENGAKVLAKGARRIGKDTLLIVDPTDLIKKYARKMENLAEVRDAGEKKIGNGYWMCEVVGAEVGSSEITPLAQTLSTSAKHDRAGTRSSFLLGSLAWRKRKIENPLHARAQGGKAHFWHSRLSILRPGRRYQIHLSEGRERAKTA